MGIFDGIGTFIKDNKDWITPVANFGINQFKQNSTQGSQDVYGNLLRSQADAKLANGQAAYDAALAQQGVNAQNAGISAANANARASAAAQNDKNRLKALKKSGKVVQAGYKASQALLDPYVQMGNSLIPSSQANALASQEALKNLLAASTSPDQTKLAFTNSPGQFGQVIPGFTKR